MFRKTMALILAVLFTVMTCSVCASALTAEDGITSYPVILVPGYSGTGLVKVDEDGTRTQVWGLNTDEVLQRVLARIADLGRGLVLTAKGDAEYLGSVVGEEAAEMLGVLAMNPDGTSMNNIQIINPSVEETNTAYIHANGLPDGYIAEPDLYPEIAGYIGEEKCFSFTEDWRLGAVACATRLDEYIQQVKAYTGSEKVNLIAISHGGQVTATYLSLFGYKCDVDNAVFTVPAIGGAALAYDALSNTVKLDEYLLVKYLEHGFVSEQDYEWLVEAQQLGFLDDVIHAIVPYVKDIMTSFGSIWDFIPTEYYADLRDSELDPVLNAAIIEKSDYFHYTVLANMGEALRRCKDEYGMNVTIIAGTGLASVTGLQECSDAIITVNASTGALTAPYGKRFNDGYAGAHLSCADVTHNHISPSMEVDATCAYLPENTWYVDELYHGMTFLDSYSRQLAITTLLTDKITDVASDPAYPQFHASTNASNAVIAYFNNSVEGYVSSADTSFIIKNISKEYPITVTAITFAGVTLNAAAFGISEIAPGETAELPFTGELPGESRRLMQVTVDYIMSGNYVLPTGKRSFDFTVMNGAPVEYDSENPFVDADYSSQFENLIGQRQTEKFKNIGIFNLLQMIYNIFHSLFEQYGILDYINK